LITIQLSIGSRFSTRNLSHV